MKTLILAVALLSALETSAYSYGAANQRQSISAARQAEINRAKQARLAVVRSTSDQGASGGLGGGIAPAWTAPAPTNPAVQAFRAQHCPNTNFNNLDSTPSERVYLKVPQYRSCIEVYCDADLNRNGALDIDEYVGVGEACTGVNTPSGRPYDQASCIGAGAIWVIDYSQTGSGYIQHGNCYMDTISNRQSVFSGLECNITRVPTQEDPEPSQTTTAHSTEGLCVRNSETVGAYQNYNNMNVPDTNGIINGEIHQDCLSAYWLYSNPFVYRTCTNGGVTNYQCVRSAADSTVGSTTIGGVSRSCGQQLDAYFNR